MKWETDVSGIDLCNRWFKSFISASTDKTSLRFCRYTWPLTSVHSQLVFFPRLTPLPSRQWSLVIYSLPDCRIFPSSYCRIVVFYRIVVFPSSLHRPFSLRFIFGLSFFLSSYFWIAVFTRLSFFPTSYCLIVVLFTGLTLFPSSYCRIVVLFTRLSLFPSSYYRFSLRLITN